MTTTTPPASGKQLTRQQQRRMSIRVLFDSQKPELAKLLPPGMDAERLFRMALTECVKNPDLLECSAESWALALQTCGAQGLYPDSGLGYMYLIPRKNVVTAQRGYQGDMKLARNTGEIKSIGAEVVYKRDVYKVVKGLAPTIEHVPFVAEDEKDDDPGPLRACYAFAQLTNGEVVFVTLTRRDVMRHKAASSMDTSKPTNPWVKHEAAMWKKTAIHELFKWIPKDSEKVEKLARDISRGDTDAIETTAIDLGQAQIPVAGEAGSSLDQLADELDRDARPAGVADAPAGAPACPDHPTQTIENGDGSRGCFACKWTSPAPAIDPDAPGAESEPPPPTEAEARAAVQAVAAKAGDTTKAPDKSGAARQRRLE
jgi:recombination protein RecT